MSKTQIARLKITLDHVDPVVMRRVVVPLNMRLHRLHTLVQVAMGWSGGHLWAFVARGVEWGPREPGGDFRDGPLDASKARLDDALEDVGTKTIKYIYDFGDGWQHTIKAERLFPAVSGLDLPFLLDAIGRCPPEDIGGPAAYMELLTAVADAKHPRHADAIELLGVGFKPSAVDARALEKAVDELASRWARPSRMPKTATGRRAA